MKKINFNTNLITLKCVLFLFFGAIGSLLPFLPLHMNAIGLSKDESTLISIFSPLIALLGPCIAAPLADRLAGGFGGAPRSKTGRYLRVMISLCLIFGTVFYWLLIIVPPVIRSPPNVAFMCDEQGGFIIQDRCGADKVCYNWGESKGSVLVKNCIFSCNASTSYTGEPTTIRPEDDSSNFDGDYPYDEVSGDGYVLNEAEVPREPVGTSSPGWIPHPHMCITNDSGFVLCEVYTEYSKPIDFRIGLKPNVEDTEEEEEEGTCKYPFVDPFHCRITSDVRKNLTKDGTEECNPIVLCEIHDPYNNTGSLLKISQCGYGNMSFWIYLFIRSLADIFMAAAVVLLATAVVIATRETSTGRGDIGKQFALGALGLAIFAPLIGGAAGGRFLEAMICFTVLLAVAVLILIVDNKMPLSPPEWWWHTRCGLLALPMSSVRKYGLETAAVATILLLLGIFWNAIDSFLPWHIVSIKDGTALIIGFTITIGALPSVVYLIFAERQIDYVGHINMLLICFVTYIIHHIGLSCITNAIVLLVLEAMEIISLHMMYITAVLYLRHLVPRKLTACGQAIPVITHFCLGRCLGALLGGLAFSAYEYNSFFEVHKWFSVAAAVIATLYFLIYHFYLKPKCVAPTQLPPDPAPAVVQSMNGNGSYTPLRVYHNSRAKKGHFRY